MATSTTTSSPPQYMVTKNTKFEAKLARYLISNPGDRLLGYDACIEKTDGNINYRLIVLGLESIYLPDNPPKIAQLSQPYIYYRDILRAEMIDDYPDFLSGTEKMNTIHMRLRVMMPGNKNKKRKKKKPKAISVDDMETISSLFDRTTLENIHGYMEDLSPRRTTSNRDLYQAPLSQLYAAIPLLLSSSSAPTTTTTNNELPATDPFQLSLSQLDDLSSSGNTFNTSVEFKERLEQLNLGTDRSHFQRLFTSRRAASDEQAQQRRSTSARSISKKKTNIDTDWLSDTPRLNRYVLQKHEDDQYGTLHTPRSTSRRNQDDEMLLSTARSTLTDLSLTSTMNNSNFNETSSTVYCPSLEEVRSLRDDVDEDMKDIDIYFLTLTSKIPEILSAALSNYIIVSTLLYDRQLRLSTLSTLNHLQPSTEKTAMKFSQLKTEIFQSIGDTPELIKLTDELSNACEKYSKVKELFWKDPDLFIFYVAQLQTNIQTIMKNQQQEQHDEHIVNFSFAIMQLLNQVFLNTFASSERLARLTHDQCSRLHMLVTCLLIPPTNLLSTSTAADDSLLNENLKDNYKVVLQWMFVSCSLLWQIGDLLERLSWTSKDFRFQHFIQLFEKQEQRDDYFDLFIDALTTLTMNNENKDPLSPKHTLYVYQLFSILSMLLINSSIFEKYLRDRYLEDFKYFLKEDDILSRIPVQYPVYRFIPDLVRSVHYHIIYGESNMGSSHRSMNRQLI